MYGNRIKPQQSLFTISIVNNPLVTQLLYYLKHLLRIIDFVFFNFIYT